MHGLNQRELNCLGERCPAPILKVAKEARKLGASGGGLLDVAADDPAFPLDLRSWCNSANAELVRLVDERGVHRAQVRISARTKGGTVITPVDRSQPANTAVGQTAVETLDCRGLQCPQPILKLSKFARRVPPGTEIHVLSDDPAFPMDVKSWCRSAGAELSAIEQQDGAHRAYVRTASKGGATKAPPPARRGTPPQPPAAAAPTPAAPVAAAVAAAPTPAAAPVADSATPQPHVTHVDLRGLTPDAWRTRLDKAHAFARFGERFRITADVAEVSQPVMQWCTDTENTFLKFDGSGPVTAEVEILTPPQTKALAIPESDNRVTLFVMHNDHEALLAALLVAVSSASQGKDVTLFFTLWGLNLLRGDSPNRSEAKEKTSMMQKMMKWMMPKGPQRQKMGQMHFGGAGKAMMGHIMSSKNLMGLPALLQTAEEQRIRFIACTMSMDIMGIGKRDLVPRSNLEYGGVAAFVDSAHGAGMNLVF